MKSHRVIIILLLQYFFSGVFLLGVIFRNSLKCHSYLGQDNHVVNEKAQGNEADWNKHAGEGHVNLFVLSSECAV